MLPCGETPKGVRHDGCTVGKTSEAPTGRKMNCTHREANKPMKASAHCDQIDFQYIFLNFETTI